MCYPPCPWNSIVVKPPPVWIFHIFVEFSDLLAGFEDIHSPIWLILRQNISNDSTSVLQSRWPAQRKSYMYMNPEIREWNFKKSLSFSPYRCSTNLIQPTLILLCPRLVHTEPIRIPCDECVYPQTILLQSSVFSFVPSWFECLGSAVTPNPMRFENWNGVVCQKTMFCTEWTK